MVSHSPGLSLSRLLTFFIRSLPPRPTPRLSPIHSHSFTHSPSPILPYPFSRPLSPLTHSLSCPLARPLAAILSPHPLAISPPSPSHFSRPLISLALLFLSPTLPRPLSLAHSPSPTLPRPLLLCHSPPAHSLLLARSLSLALSDSRHSTTTRPLSRLSPLTLSLSPSPTSLDRPSSPL